jgi:thiamine pyrophosphokinase
MRAVICAAGQVADYRRVRALLGTPDLVVCADAGVRHAEALGLRPDLVVGDFDSSPPGTLQRLKATGIETRILPAAKDWTDTELAVRAALERGATSLLLVGCTGDRLDHTIANLQLLAGLPPGVSAVAVDAKNIVQAVGPAGEVVLDGEPGQFLSLIPLSLVVSGIDAEGVRWPLSGATLGWGMSLGVSNQFAGGRAVVRVQEGVLLVIRAWD